MTRLLNGLFPGCRKFERFAIGRKTDVVAVVGKVDGEHRICPGAIVRLAAVRQEPSPVLCDEARDVPPFHGAGILRAKQRPKAQPDLRDVKQ